MADEIEMIPVTSSNVAAIGYDEEEKVLRVAFNNGAEYEYDGVSVDTFEHLRDAGSVGGYFNSVIKRRYEGRRVS